MTREKGEPKQESRANRRRQAPFYEAPGEARLVKRWAAANESAIGAMVSIRRAPRRRRSRKLPLAFPLAAGHQKRRAHAGGRRRELMTERAPPVMDSEPRTKGWRAAPTPTTPAAERNPVAPPTGATGAFNG